MGKTNRHKNRQLPVVVDETETRRRVSRAKSIETTPTLQEQIETVPNQTHHFKENLHRKPRPKCSCRGVCCKLFLTFVFMYLVLYLRPEYSLFLHNSIENALKKFNLTSEEFRLRPGERLIGIRKPSMPIIIIPGIISTGLELWQGEKCAEGRFRHRFWTSLQMVDNIGRDHQCWLRHISLNLSTWFYLFHANFG